MRSLSTAAVRPHDLCPHTRNVHVCTQDVASLVASDPTAIETASAELRRSLDQGDGASRRRARGGRAALRGRPAAVRRTGARRQQNHDATELPQQLAVGRRGSASHGTLPNHDSYR